MGKPIEVPVGPETLGRIINVIGDPIDERGPVGHTRTSPIHKPAPEFVEQSTEQEVLVTGIKVVDLLAPYQRGGKIGLFGGAGVGKDRADHGVDQQHREDPRRLFPCSPASASAPARATTSTTR